MNDLADIIAKHNRQLQSTEEQTIDGMTFRRHGDGWYPRCCSMCAHFRYDRPYAPVGCGAGIVEAWNERVNEQGETVILYELAYPTVYTPPEMPERLCAAYLDPNGWPGEPLNLDAANVNVSKEVPDWCDRFLFFFEDQP